MDEEDEYVRPPIAPKVMKLIDDDNRMGIDNDSDSEDEYEDEYERVLRLSVKDAYGDVYDRKRKLKQQEKENDIIYESIQSSNVGAKEQFKNFKKLLKEDEDQEKCKKISAKITLFVNGINDNIRLDSDLYYHFNQVLYKLENNEERGYIYEMVKPTDPVEYDLYCSVMDSSKNDTKNENSIEIKKRKALFTPVLNKFTFLRSYDKKTKELENRIMNDISLYLNNKSDTIAVDENDYKIVISIINSTKSKDKELLKNIIITKDA